MTKIRSDMSRKSEITSLMKALTSMSTVMKARWRKVVLRKIVAMTMNRRLSLDSMKKTLTISTTTQALSLNKQAAATRAETEHPPRRSLKGQVSRLRSKRKADLVSKAKRDRSKGIILKTLTNGPRTLNTKRTKMTLSVTVPVSPSSRSMKAARKRLERLVDAVSGTDDDISLLKIAINCKQSVFHDPRTYP